MTVGVSFYEAELWARWQPLCRRIAPASTQCGNVYRDLVAPYSDRDRHYHNLAHIAWCLREFDTVRNLSPDPDAVETAIWFHDVVYDPRRLDNEERSAAFADAALARLDAGRAFRAEVSRLILLTRHDQPPSDLAGQLIVDIDLSSLGAAPEVFDENGRNIRKEFAHVDEATYAKSRAQILRKFNARPRVYLTDVFFERYESSARSNLRRAIDAMEG